MSLMSLNTLVKQCGKSLFQRTSQVEMYFLQQSRMLSHDFYSSTRSSPVNHSGINSCFQSQRIYQRQILCARVSLRQPCRFAGHSKWQNIKHVKGAKDAQKNKDSNRIAKDIKVALREGGSSNPDFNSQLRRVLEHAKTLNIPKTTINNVIKSAEKSSKDGKVMFVEARGPLASFLIVEVVTSRAIYTRNLIQSVLKKFGGCTGDLGTAGHAFASKGLIQVGLEESVEMNKDQAEEIAIEVGAEEVKIITEDDKKVLQFICDNKELGIVRKALEEQSREILAAHLGYVAVNFVEIDSANQEVLAPMFDLLEDIEEVVRVYDNFRFT